MSIINYVFRVNNHKGLILVDYRKHACKSCPRYLSKKFPFLDSTCELKLTGLLMFRAYKDILRRSMDEVVIQPLYKKYNGIVLFQLPKRPKFVDIYSVF